MEEDETFEPIYRNKKQEYHQLNAQHRETNLEDTQDTEDFSIQPSSRPIRSTQVIKGTKTVVDDKPPKSKRPTSGSSSTITPTTISAPSSIAVNQPESNVSAKFSSFSLKSEDEKDLGDLLYKSKEEQRNDMIEKLQTEQTQLEIYITTIIGLLPSMGSKDGDNRKTRRAIEQVREKSKQTAKHIHELMDTMLKDWIDRKDDDPTTVKYMKQQYRAFQEQYTSLLAKLQIVFQEIQDRESAFPFSKLPVDVSHHSNNDSSLHQTDALLSKGQIALSNQQVLEPEYFDEDAQDLEDEQQIEVIERDITELLEIFQSLTDSVQEQEEQLKKAEQQITEAHKTVAQSVKGQQSAKKYALIGLGIVGAIATTFIGAGIGALVAGPVGVAASLPASASVAAGLAVGAGIGLTGGVVGSAVTSKLVQRIHGLKKKTSVELETKSSKK